MSELKVMVHGASSPVPDSMDDDFVEVDGILVRRDVAQSEGLILPQGQGRDSSVRRGGARKIFLASSGGIVKSNPHIVTAQGKLVENERQRSVEECVPDHGGSIEVVEGEVEYDAVSSNPFKKTDERHAELFARRFGPQERALRSRKDVWGTPVKGGLRMVHDRWIPEEP